MRILKAFCVAVGLILLTAAASAQPVQRVTVFAAASLKNALDQIVSQWRAETGNAAVVSYAASSALAARRLPPRRAGDERHAPLVEAPG